MKRVINFRYTLIGIGGISALICAYFVILSITRFILVTAESINDAEFSKSTYNAKLASCYRSAAWCPRPLEIPILAELSPRRWGSFRPGSYFGMKTKTLASEGDPGISTGIMWGPSILQGRSLRDNTAQDELTRFDWLRHDGRNFGTEKLIDDSYNLHINASFVIPHADGVHDEAEGTETQFRQLPSWSQKFVIVPTDTEFSSNSNEEKVARLNEDHRKTLIFYLGTDCDGNNCSEGYLRDLKVKSHTGSKERGYEQAISIVGHSQSTGWFCLFFMIQSLDSINKNNDAQSTLSYYGYSKTDLLRGKERLKRDAQRAAFGQGSNTVSGRGKDTSAKSAYNDFGDLQDKIDGTSGFVAIQASFTRSVRIDTLFFEHIEVGENGPGFFDLIISAMSGDSQKSLPYFMRQQITAAGEMRKLPAGPSATTGTAVAKSSSEVVVDTSSTALVNVIPTAGDRVRIVVDEWYKNFTSEFEIKFEDVFQLRSKVDLTSDTRQTTDKDLAKMMFAEDDIEAAKVCFSSLLGGIGYFQGEPEIASAVDDALDDEHESEKSTVDGTDIDKAQGFDVSKEVLKVPRTVSLFSATPSRTSFPRGFLWDEGYHQMLISQWDTELTLEVVGSWLRALHYHCSAEDVCPGGWIPREMILGEEARQRVPREFITQRVNVANPPTILLVLEGLLDRFSSNDDISGCGIPSSSSEGSTGTEVIIDNPEALSCVRQPSVIDPEEQKKVLSFLRDVYPALEAWLQWFHDSQKGSQPDSFRWKGRSKKDGKVIPNTLASGLDDYPRAQVPSARECHVDLHSWLVRANAILEKIHKNLSKFQDGKFSPQRRRGAAIDYGKLRAKYSKRLDELFWSDDTLPGYYDVGINDDNAGVEIGLFVTCSDETGRSRKEIVVPKRVIDSKEAPHRYCPAEQPIARDLVWRQPNVPKAVYMLDTSNASLSHIPRVGYVSLFPFLMKLIPADSPKLEAVLNVIEDPEHLWTDYGLRSLSKQDKYYAVKNAGDDEPYWRGYIWIPINYLAMSALHHYASMKGSPYQTRALTLYHKLRHGLIRNVLDEYHRTGYFWEQYDDRTGKGLRGHPFTGWTALIVNIMAEKFI